MTEERLAILEEMCRQATEVPWDEAWKAIAGYDGYEVSDQGHVRSHFMKGTHKRGHAGKPRNLRLQLSTKGYPVVSLPLASGQYRYVFVHHLVMSAFAGPRQKGTEVAHLNGILTDARLENLAYVSRQEWEEHKKMHANVVHRETRGASRLLGWQVEEILYLADHGIPQVRIAALFEVSKQKVQSIVSGTSSGHMRARSDLPELLAEARQLKAERIFVRTMLQSVEEGDLNPTQFYDRIASASPAAIMELYTGLQDIIGMEEAEAAYRDQELGGTKGANHGDQ